MRQRVRIDGRLTSIGLGPYPEVPLADARQEALDKSLGLRLAQDARGRGIPTCGEATKQTIELDLVGRCAEAAKECSGFVHSTLPSGPAYSRNVRMRSAVRSAAATSHSQITSTSQPSSVSWARCSASRAVLRSSFGNQ